MIILKVSCDNLYMFKKFEVDLTYNRQVSHPLSASDRLFQNSKIKVRKNLILLGANASGKTTFGKLLCLILNYIRGNNINLEAAIYDKNKIASFEIEFVIDDIAYLLKANFKNSILQTEELRRHKIRKTYDIATLREKISTSATISSYNSEVGEINVSSQSYAFGVSRNAETKILREKISYWFRFSEDFNYSTDYEKIVDVELISEILPKVDNSIKNVKRMYADDRPTNSYLINFKNGETMTIPDGDLRHCVKRLSHGTFEAIDFVSMINILRLEKSDVFYIDELLAHMHSELETYLIRKAFVTKPYDSQIFFTTHNTQILLLNAPMNAFMFFKRNAEGFNEVVYPSEKINKNDRNLMGYYENDYFGILPDYSSMDSLFENWNDDEQNFVHSRRRN